MPYHYDLSKAGQFVVLKFAIETKFTFTVHDDGKTLFNLLGSHCCCLGKGMFLLTGIHEDIAVSLFSRVSLYSFLGPVVQSIVSLTTSLRRQLVKYMWTTYQICYYFLLEKCENLLLCKRFSHFFNKNDSIFVIFTFKILTKR